MQTLSAPRTAIALATGLTVVLAGAAAVAQAPADDTVQRLAEWDGNGDGTLSLAEFTAEARVAFDAVDDDRNGAISVEELEEAAPQAQGGLSAAHRIALIDGNEDGTLALDEYEEDLEALFEALDGNGDAQLDVGELTLAGPGRLPRP